MQTDTTTGSGAPDAKGSGAPDATTTGKDNADLVARADHERALADLHKEKQARQKLESDLAEAKRAKQTEAGDFKSLYESVKADYDALQTKHATLKENIVYSEKYKTVSQAALKAGMRPDALKLLEKESLEELAVETTSQGRFLVHGADSYVEKLKREMAFAFETKTAPGGVNSGGGASASADAITPAKLYELEKSKGLRSAEYTTALAQYKEQKNKRV